MSPLLVLVLICDYERGHFILYFPLDTLLPPFALEMNQPVGREGFPLCY
jgi:hypothetical protein